MFFFVFMNHIVERRKLREYHNYENCTVLLSTYLPTLDNIKSKNILTRKKFFYPIIHFPQKGDALIARSKINQVGPLLTSSHNFIQIIIFFSSYFYFGA